jgi:hypothetical protein
MTQRKPSDLNFTSWIDLQIDEAARRGAFDDLPGAGKPLPKVEGDASQAWLRDYAHREGVSPDDLLPIPLRLRKEIERLTATVGELPTEERVRAEAADLNRQIIQWRRIPEGPPVYLRLLDAQALVSQWRAAHPEQPLRPDPVPSPPRRRSAPRWASRWLGRRQR